jgi:hypothetical protein
MEHVPCIVVQRFPYEEPYHAQLSIAASNGRYSGIIEIYCAVGQLRDIGIALTKFPAKIPDEYLFEYGSEDPKERWAYHLKLRASTVGSRGLSAIQFTMNLNREPPDEGRCCFSITPVEPAQIARLGRLFVRLEAHASGSFRWTLKDDEFQSDKGAGAA